jgi:hypothetical protein
VLCLLLMSSGLLRYATTAGMLAAARTHSLACCSAPATPAAGTCRLLLRARRPKVLYLPACSSQLGLLQLLGDARLLVAAPAAAHIDHVPACQQQLAGGVVAALPHLQAASSRACAVQQG